MGHDTDAEEPGLIASLPQESQAEGPTAVSERPLATAAQAEAFHRAGFWLRLVAFTIDLVVLGIFSSLLLLVGFLISRMGAEFSSFSPDASASFSWLALCQLTNFIATAAYFTILHSEAGQTIGKSLLGLEVCTLDGQPLSYGHALVRFVAYGFSFFSLGLGFLWVALNPGKRGWHDLLVGTMVVVSKNREQ